MEKALKQKSKFRILLRDNDIRRFCEASLKRMVKDITTRPEIRVGKSFYSEVANAAQERLDNVLQLLTATVIAENRKTLQLNDVLDLLVGRKPEHTREFFVRPEVRRVDEYESWDGDDPKDPAYYFAKLPFERTVRQLAQDYTLDLRIGKGVLGALQMYIEDYIGELIDMSIEAAAGHGGRKTLFAKDARLIVDLRAEDCV